MPFRWLCKYCVCYAICTAVISVPRAGQCTPDPTSWFHLYSTNAKIIWRAKDKWKSKNEKRNVSPLSAVKKRDPNYLAGRLYAVGLVYIRSTARAHRQRRSRFFLIFYSICCPGAEFTASRFTFSVTSVTQNTEQQYWRSRKLVNTCAL